MNVRVYTVDFELQTLVDAQYNFYLAYCVKKNGGHTGLIALQ